MIVYALADPSTREIRYIGQTIRPALRRLSQHICSSNQKTTPPVNAWLRGIGVRAEIIEIEKYDDPSSMNEGEKYWISQFIAMGARLLNISEGGTTRVGYRHSQGTREKWSRERRGENAPMFGKRRTPEQRAMFSELTRKMIASKGHPMQGRKHSPEARERMSAAQNARQARERATREGRTL